MLFALAISFQLVKSQMVETVKRDDGLISVRMKNNFDQAYLVSSYRYTSLLVTDQSYRHLSIWVGSRFPPCSPIFPTHS